MQDFHLFDCAAHRHRGMRRARRRERPGPTDAVTAAGQDVGRCHCPEVAYQASIDRRRNRPGRRRQPASRIRQRSEAARGRAPRCGGGHAGWPAEQHPRPRASAARSRGRLWPPATAPRSRPSGLRARCSAAADSAGRWPCRACRCTGKGRNCRRRTACDSRSAHCPPARFAKSGAGIDDLNALRAEPPRPFWIGAAHQQDVARTPRERRSAAPGNRRKRGRKGKDRCPSSRPGHGARRGGDGRTEAVHKRACARALQGGDKARDGALLAPSGGSEDMGASASPCRRVAPVAERSPANCTTSVPTAGADRMAWR